MEAFKCLVAKVCIFTLFYRSIVTILKINLLFGIVGSCKKPDLQLRKVTWHLITGVEKKNDDLRRYFHCKINRWDAATNLLARFDMLLHISFSYWLDWMKLCYLYLCFDHRKTLVNKTNFFFLLPKYPF